MDIKREFFPSVRKTVLPRPPFAKGVDILGQRGTAWATQAAVSGDNFHVDHHQGLIEIYGAGAAICFAHLLPHKEDYEKEGLYLRLKLAYRTTENANVNIRDFSGNYVDLPNSLHGHMYDDPNILGWITDDLTLNINSIYTDEKIWIQRVDWEWMRAEVVYEDEMYEKPLDLERSPQDVVTLYGPQEITSTSLKDFLIAKNQQDNEFAKRHLTLLNYDRPKDQDLTELFKESGMSLVA